MAQLVYPSIVEMEVKPSIVKMNFSIRTENVEAKAAINSLNEKINMIKKHCFSVSSYRPESYKQSNITFNKNTYKEYYYVNKNDIEDIISVKMYDDLDERLKIKYTNQSRNRFLNYSASVNLNITLDNNNTVIDDFTSIINLVATDESIRCTYEHTILPSERQDYMNQLYIKCVNQGMKNITDIANGVSYFDASNIKIMEISEQVNRTGAYQSDFAIAKCMDMDSFEKPEQLFIPELIKELFNNNIVLTKRLEILVSL